MEDKEIAMLDVLLIKMSSAKLTGHTPARAVQTKLQCSDQRQTSFHLKELVQLLSMAAYPLDERPSC